nr:unnamed protein product [Digitaria exilis]
MAVVAMPGPAQTLSFLFSFFPAPAQSSSFLPSPRTGPAGPARASLSPHPRSRTRLSAASPSLSLSRPLSFAALADSMAPPVRVFFFLQLVDRRLPLHSALTPINANQAPSSTSFTLTAATALNRHNGRFNPIPSPSTPLRPQPPWPTYKAPSTPRAQPPPRFPLARAHAAALGARRRHCRRRTQLALFLRRLNYFLYGRFLPHRSSTFLLKPRIAISRTQRQHFSLQFGSLTATNPADRRHSSPASVGSGSNGPRQPQIESKGETTGFWLSSSPSCCGASSEKQKGKNPEYEAVPAARNNLSINWTKDRKYPYSNPGTHPHVGPTSGDHPMSYRLRSRLSPTQQARVPAHAEQSSGADRAPAGVDTRMLASGGPNNHPTRRRTHSSPNPPWQALTLASWRLGGDVRWRSALRRTHRPNWSHNTRAALRALAPHAIHGGSARGESHGESLAAQPRRDAPADLGTPSARNRSAGGSPSEAAHARRSWRRCATAANDVPNPRNVVPGQLSPQAPS